MLTAAGSMDTGAIMIVKRRLHATGPCGQLLRQKESFHPEAQISGLKISSKGAAPRRGSLEYKIGFFTMAKEKGPHLAWRELVHLVFGLSRVFGSTNERDKTAPRTR